MEASGGHCIYNRTVPMDRLEVYSRKHQRYSIDKKGGSPSLSLIKSLFRRRKGEPNQCRMERSHSFAAVEAKISYGKKMPKISEKNSRTPISPSLTKKYEREELYKTASSILETSLLYEHCDEKVQQKRKVLIDKVSNEEVEPREISNAINEVIFAVIDVI